MCGLKLIAPTVSTIPTLPHNIIIFFGLNQKILQNDIF